MRACWDNPEERAVAPRGQKTLPLAAGRGNVWPPSAHRPSEAAGLTTSQKPSNSDICSLPDLTSNSAWNTTQLCDLPPVTSSLTASVSSYVKERKIPMNHSCRVCLQHSQLVLTGLQEQRSGCRHYDSTGGGGEED